jgi:glycine oxidase
VEEVGFDAATTESGLEELLQAAREAMPLLAEAEVLRHWAGLRPQALRRGGPFVGPLPGYSDVWVHCGHYRSGVLLSPLTARLLVHRLLGEESDLEREGFDLEAFHALRVDR